MAKKTLVIVESPAKSHTISKYLGDDFVISSSMGHVRDLPAAVLGIDLKNNYRPSLREPARQGPADQGAAQAGPGRRAHPAGVRPRPRGRGHRLPPAADPPGRQPAHPARAVQRDHPRLRPGSGAKAHGHRRPQGRFPADAPPAGPPRRLQDQPGAAAQDRRAALGRARPVHRPEADRGKGEGDPRLRFRGVLDRRRGAAGLAQALLHRQAGKIRRQGHAHPRPGKLRGDPVRAAGPRLCPGAHPEKIAQTQGAAAADHLHPAAGGVPPLQVPGEEDHAAGPAAVRGADHPRRRGHRPDHLHAHRLLPRFRPGPRPGPRAHRGDAGQGVLPGLRQRLQAQVQDPGRPRVHPPQRSLPRARRHPRRPESRPIQDLPAHLGEVLRLADGRRRDRGNAVRRQERRLPVRQQGRDREVQGLPGHAEDRRRADGPAAAAGKRGPAAAEDWTTSRTSPSRRPATARPRWSRCSRRKASAARRPMPRSSIP